MKRTLLTIAILATASSASVDAQTCANPVFWRPSESGVPALTGTICTGETSILSLCESASDGHTHANVFRFTSASAGTYSNITIQNTGFTAYVAIVNVNVAGACNGNGDTGHCVTSGDIATPVQHANIPDGEYYLIISNSGADLPTACGTYTLTSNGFLPVTLQEFDVS